MESISVGIPSRSPHPDERGLSWGGYVDEFDALAGTPSQLMSQGMPKGIQGQVFAETIRCFLCQRLSTVTTDGWP